MKQKGFHAVELNFRVNLEIKFFFRQGGNPELVNLEKEVAFLVQIVIFQFRNRTKQQQLPIMFLTASYVLAVLGIGKGVMVMVIVIVMVMVMGRQFAK